MPKLLQKASFHEKCNKMQQILSVHHTLFNINNMC